MGDRLPDGAWLLLHLPWRTVELHEMIDVQIWAEEMDVQTWFIGL
jgi:hypothetical protein